MTWFQGLKNNQKKVICARKPEKSTSYALKDYVAKWNGNYIHPLVDYEYADFNKDQYKINIYIIIHIDK